LTGAEPASTDEIDQAASVSRHGALPRDELRRRASAGVSIVATRGLAILLISFGGNVVIARILTPHDFGVVAIGMTLVYFISTLADGGLGAALIRRAEAPDRDELEALMAFQLSGTVGLAVVIAAAAIPFGQIGGVIALMVTSMPLVMLQWPGRILLERSLSYRPLALVELSQVLVYQAWAIGLVVAGFGVWSLASGTVVMRVAAALVMAVVCPAGIVRPRFSWCRVRPLIGFGLRFQGASATTLVEGQGLNASIAAIASVSTLGLWSLARRIMEVPFLLFDSLWRVSFPTMSRLIAANEDVAPLLERAVGMAAAGSGVILTGLAGSSPGLIPGLFGGQWHAAAGVIPAACLGLGIGGSLSVATVGYLYAVGDASAVLRALLFRAIVTFAVVLPLLPVLGATATGLGWLIASVVEGAVLRRATLKWTHVRLVRPLLIPVIVGTISAAAGWLVASRGGANLGSGLLGGMCSVLLFLAGLSVLDGKLLRETFRFALESIRGAAFRGADVDVEAGAPRR
jgi:O-antigen/teichoic acid export membrane protein